jgi:YfiH family protein
MFSSPIPWAEQTAPPQIIQIQEWSKASELPWLIHGFSTRLGGKSRVYRPEQASDLNLGFTASDDRSIVAGNRKRLLETATGSKPMIGLVTLRQIHSSLTLRVGAGDVHRVADSAVLEGDGLMTDEPGVLLGIQTADCVPVLVADVKKRSVAAFHAGWRGTVSRIVEKGIDRMCSEFGSASENLIAAVGPAIGQCCYSVGEQLRQEFTAQFTYAAELFHERAAAAGSEQAYQLHLDLPEANRRQLLAAGLKDSAIAMTDLCTGCHTDRFFSHRIERGFTGRMMSVIGVALEKLPNPQAAG